MKDVHLFPKYAVCTVFFVCLHVAVWGAPFMDTTAPPHRRNTTARLTARRPQQPAQPTLWHQSDTAIISPSFTDTIAPPTSYTMMMVYQTLQPNVPQQLWRISRTDSVFYAITTHGLSTERIQPSARNNPTRTTPTIYTLQHTLRPDTAYRGIYQLHTGATASDSSRIALYEIAYFDSRLTKCQSLMFQTYLAIKHGITLDNAPYLSTRGDTLWHPKTDKTYYHRLQGIGADTVYYLNTQQSTSLEDSLLHIFTANPLPINTYALIGDDDVPVGWSPYENGYALLQRTWQLRTTDTLPNICIALNKDHLSDAPDTLALILFNADGDITQTIYPDSTNAADQLCYTISRPATYTWFSFLTTDNETPHRHQVQKNNKGNNNNDKDNKNRNNQNNEDNTNNEGYANYGDYALSLTPNPTHGEYVLSISLPQAVDLMLTTQDPTGKVVTRQTLTGATDYRHSGFLPVAGMYLFSLYTQDGELLTTRELLVRVSGVYYYHPDHLGSATWITNSEKQPVQYLHYMPFGELWENQQAFEYDERFKFTGKERDTETGYDYFGARYYLSLLGIWLSPDPFIDKNAGISSYAFCSWNPINRLDPNGMDDIEIDKRGFIINYDKTNYNDNICIKDSDNPQWERELTLPGQYISEPFNAERLTVKGDVVQMDFLPISDDVIGEQIFSFVADNTDIEWSLNYIDEQGTILSTSHQERSEAGCSYIFNRYSMRGHTHNHPFSINPSASDKQWAQKMLEKYPLAPLKIYYYGTLYNHNAQGLIVPNVK